VNAFDLGLMPGTGWCADGPLPCASCGTMCCRMLVLLPRAISPSIYTPAESGAAFALLINDSAQVGVSGKYFEGTREIPSSKESR
jgi:hypothetical protein